MDIAFCYESVLPERGGCETYIPRLAPAPRGGRACRPPVRLPLGPVRLARGGPLPPPGRATRPARLAAVAVRRRLRPRPARGQPRRQRRLRQDLGPGRALPPGRP